jgi:hypothetical protein
MIQNRRVKKVKKEESRKKQMGSGLWDSELSVGAPCIAPMKASCCIQKGSEIWHGAFQIQEI